MRRSSTTARFDAIRFRGPGTDLTVGLIPGASWCTALEETVEGRRHVVNMPTEEVFTTPDRRRTQGTVRSTKPLALSGTIVRDLEVRFEGGRAVEVQASSGAELIREQLRQDENAALLGEVALVDGDSRVGRSGLVFLNTLFDENATLPHRLRRRHPRGASRGRRRRVTRSSRRSASTAPRSTPTS